MLAGALACVAAAERPFLAADFFASALRAQQVITGVGWATLRILALAAWARAARARVGPSWALWLAAFPLACGAASMLIVAAIKHSHVTFKHLRFYLR